MTINVNNSSNVIWPSSIGETAPAAQQPSLDAYLNKLTEQVEKGELNEAVVTLKEAAVETKQNHMDILRKYWAEHTEISASHRVQRGSWYMLLLKDPEAAGFSNIHDLKDPKEILANAIREFNSALHQKTDEREFCINTSEKLITCYIQLTVFEIAEGNIQDAKAGLELGKQCVKHLSAQAPKDERLEEFKRKLMYIELFLITLKKAEDQTDKKADDQVEKKEEDQTEKKAEDQTEKKMENLQIETQEKKN